MRSLFHNKIRFVFDSVSNPLRKILRLRILTHVVF